MEIPIIPFVLERRVVPLGEERTELRRELLKGERGEAGVDREVGDGGEGGEAELGADGIEGGLEPWRGLEGGGGEPGHG